MDFFCYFLLFFLISVEKKQAQSLIFGCFHHGPLPWPFIINAAQMEHSMHYHAMELLIIIGVLQGGIAAHCVEADKYIAIDYMAFGVVEGYDVGIVVVGEVLTIDLQYLLVVAEHISQLAYGIAVVSCHRAEPPRSVAASEMGEGDGFGVIGEHEGSG